MVQAFTSDLQGKTPNEWLRQLVDSRYREAGKEQDSGHQLHQLYASVDCAPLPPPSGKTASIEEAWAAWGKPDDVDGFYALAQRVTGKADHNDIGADGWAAVIEAMQDDNMPY